MPNLQGNFLELELTESLLVEPTRGDDETGLRDPAAIGGPDRRRRFRNRIFFAQLLEALSDHHAEDRHSRLSRRLRSSPRTARIVQAIVTLGGRPR